MKVAELLDNILGTNWRAELDDESRQRLNYDVIAEDSLGIHPSVKGVRWDDRKEYLVLEVLG